MTVCKENYAGTLLRAGMDPHLMLMGDTELVYDTLEEILVREILEAHEKKDSHSKVGLIWALELLTDSRRQQQ